MVFLWCFSTVGHDSVISSTRKKSEFTICNLLPTPLGTFKYHMTLREGGRGLFNRQSTVIWGKGVWPNHHITFIVARKSLIYSFFALFTV